jgi:hypothetical protein
MNCTRPPEPLPSLSALLSAAGDKGPEFHPGDEKSVANANTRNEKLAGIRHFPSRIARQALAITRPVDDLHSLRKNRDAVLTDFENDPRE